MVDETSSTSMSSGVSVSRPTGPTPSEEVGGFSCKSSTSSSMVESKCSAFNLSTVLSSFGKVTPEGVRLVQ